jgi:hypothetical protein
MIVTNPALLVSEAPTIDATEARRVAAELAAIIERLGPDSPIALVLRNARRELASLAQSATGAVVGPFRIAA